MMQAVYFNEDQTSTQILGILANLEDLPNNNSNG